MEILRTIGNASKQEVIIKYFMIWLVQWTKSVGRVRKGRQDKLMQCEFKHSMPLPHKDATHKLQIGSTVCEEFLQLSPILLLH